MVEAVLTGTITSHTHNVEQIINAVSITDLYNHSIDSSHLSPSEREFLEELMSGD